MKHFCNTRVISLATILLLLLAVIAMSRRPVPAVSGAQPVKSYVLESGQWGSDQAAAVSAAGGVVACSNPDRGIAIVYSDATDFLQRAEASNKFISVTPDQVVQWQEPVQSVELEESAVTPGNETFINLQWNIKAVQAPAAWDAGFDGSGVRVAVI